MLFNTWEVDLTCSEGRHGNGGGCQDGSQSLKDFSNAALDQGGHKEEQTSKQN